MVKITNPLSDVQFDRLRKSIEWSNRQLEFSRNERIESIKEFMGFHHTVKGSRRRVIAPFLKMAITIYVRLLAARVPRALISVKDENLKSVAANLQIAVNEIPEEIKLQNTFRRIVLEALFSGYGVGKIGLHTVGEILGHKVGAPFVDVVTQDDHVIDMAAKHISQIQYQGDDYWLDYTEVMESGWKNLGGLEADQYTVIGEAGERRAEGLAQDENADLFRAKVHLRDVWLPKEKIMLTYGVKSKRRFNVIDWTGPSYGPYPMLGFEDVPGNLLPLAPVSSWRDIHELANVIYRKLANQVDSQKTVLGFPGGDEEGVKAFRKEKDGGGITYSGVEPKKLEAGGVNPNTLAMFLQTKDLSSWVAGNLDSLGGLSPQSETLGQDKLISEASNAQLRDMSAQVIDFSKEVFRSLAYYEWHDPIRRRQLVKPIPGTDLQIIVPWDQTSRRGTFTAYDLGIDVHSLQDNSPMILLQKLGMIMQQYVIPLEPHIAAQNGSLDVQFLLSKVGELADFPWMKDLVVFAQGAEDATKSQSAGKPANTTRTVNRVNRPGATESGKSQILQQVLLGGQPQGAEMASLGRATG